MRFINNVKNGILCGRCTSPKPSQIDFNEDSLRPYFKSENVIDTTSQYTIEELCYLINLSDVVVTGDTVALHIAISLGKKIVSFFGPTPHQEVNLFGLGVKLVRDELDCLNCYDQFPCPYDGKCMSLISSDVVYDKIKELL